MQRLYAFAVLFCCFALQAQSGTASRVPLVDGRYILQAGDTVEVTYTYTPEYNDTVPIASDGDVGLKQIGNIHLAGLSLPQATALIKQAATASGLNHPELVVTLRDYVRPQFTVLGEVTKPGRYEMHGTLRVADGIAIAGGLTPNARHYKIVVIHPIDDTKGTTTLISYSALQKSKGDKTFALLHAGDIVVVPTGDLSKVERLVKLANLGVFYNPF